MLNSLDVNVTLGNELALAVELCVQLSVLSFAIVVDRSLLVNFSSKGLDETNVGIYTRLVVLIHASLFFIKATEGLL